ncbi:TatD-related deoxyribonuclease [Candidatus Nitrosocosmicus arcticus]|uniref:TatD-related deoxyribonuclease n=1 Tax=Candidatus Nitrosocosmicus arcticus TaxID=2035267 RepID=A0A557SSE0_9ARCH|nr:TatD-related deoxyribonuclease [Candidatus Nitrosocosmicus arcticus]
MSDKHYQNYHSIIFDYMRQANVQSICVSEDFNSSVEALSLKEKFFKDSDLFRVFVGIHPQFAKVSSDMRLFEGLFQSKLDFIDGIGEIGLDPTYANLDPDNTLERQKIVFEKMLHLAETNNKPVSLHSRRSVNEIMEILPSYKIRNAVFHWYDGNKSNLKRINDKGYFVSFGPYLLYSSDKQTLLKEADINLILVETDGPVKYKNCFEGALTSPSLVVSIVYFASVLLKKSIDDLTEILYMNSTRFMN